MVVGILISVVIIVVVSFFFISSSQEQEEYLYKRKDFLLNIPERRFFEELQKIIPNEYVVFPQVLLSSIVGVSSPKNEFWKYHNKINRKTIDFVIFEKQYLKPIIAIEYDGKTHNRKDRQDRDEFVNEVLKMSGIKSLHIKHQKNLNFDEIGKNINNLLSFGFE